MTSKSNKRKVIIREREFDSLESAARTYGLSRNTIDYRLSKGWTPEQAVGLDPRPSYAANTPGLPVKVLGHEFKTIKEAAKHYGRSYTHIFERLKHGCTIEEALGLDPSTGLPIRTPVERYGSLQSEAPKIALQWHPTKNLPLTPEEITPGSGKKVWWLCPNGHEWKAQINNRAKGSGCPYCAGQKPTAERNFTTEYPELLKEWDSEKNHKKPEDFTPRANAKVWWKCEKGHSWQATITNRTRDTNKNGCPCCSNKKLCEDNSLAQVRPEIAKDWHPNKNAPLTPKDVIAGGNKKVWWVCKLGHEWKATIGNRVLNGTGCPKCSLQTSRIEIAVYTELDALFHGVTWREKISGYECDIFIRRNNVGVEIDGVYWHCRKPELELEKSAAFENEGILLFRLREDGLPLLSERDVSFKFTENEFHVTSRLLSSILKYAKITDKQRKRLKEYIDGGRLINERKYREIVANLPAPPPGESLADMQPDISKEWAYDLNKPLLPEHFRHKANKKVWWRCKNGHTWNVSINNRTQHGTGCPFCPSEYTVKVSGDWNLAVQYPDLAKEWHSKKNGMLRPESVRPKSNKKVWWQCGNGHAWQATVTSRVSGSGCPYCYGRLATKKNNFANKYPALLEEWDYKKNLGLDPSKLTPHSPEKTWWLCKYGHSWQAIIYNRAKNKSGCPVCSQNSRRKYTIETFQAIAIKHGGKCLSTEYKNAKTKLKFSCEEGHVWKVRADSVLYDDKWCPVCAKRR